MIEDFEVKMAKFYTSFAQLKKTQKSMKKFIFIVNFLVLLEKLKEGKSIQGSLSWSKETGLMFRAYDLKSREPGYVSPNKTLFETACGKLMETAQRYLVRISIKKSLGRQRSATEMMLESRELADHLRNTKSIEEIMDEV